MGFTIARLIAILLLFLALGTHPSYLYYKLLRFVVCGVTVYAVYFAAKMEKIGWVWPFGIIAILFNPLLPIYLRRGTWQFIDFAVVVFLIISIFMLHRKSQSSISTFLVIMLCITLAGISPLVVRWGIKIIFNFDITDIEPLFLVFYAVVWFGCLCFFGFLANKVTRLGDI